MNAETSCRPLCGATETFPQARLFNARVTGRDYRRAVADCIRGVKARHGLTNEQLAEVLGVDEKTVRNAENEDNGKLDPVTMLNIAVFYGEEAIRDIRALYLGGGQSAPTPADELGRLERELSAVRRRLESAA